MPAPPPESEPAIERTAGGLRVARATVGNLPGRALPPQAARS